MSESLSMGPDLPEVPGAAVRRSEDPPEKHGGSGAESQRVRQLPPPPKVLDRPARISGIETDRLPPTRWRRWRSYAGRRLSSGCSASFLFHFLLLLGLALAVQASGPGGDATGLTAYTSAPVSLSDDGRSELDRLWIDPGRTEASEMPWEDEYEVSEVVELIEPAAGPNRLAGEPPATGAHESADRLLSTDADVGGMLSGRSPRARAALAAGGGGTPGSETAVERGLRWLLAHQRDDGSWNFNHQKGPCGGQCRDPGTEPSTTAATAIALLPFFGAGYTHDEGEYQDAVKRGLYYLHRRTLVTPHGYDLQEGTMYAQGLCTIALCEAYAMTSDLALKDSAQGAIDFICYAQDLKGGGWRYTPGEPGDTTVTGWQLMGLKSGQMAGLAVPSPTIFLAQRFLTSVESDYGAQYGYLNPQPRQTTTAIGLLCRMYTGWPRNHPGLRRGVRLLGEWGPSEDNIYYDYYATQVMHHWQGPQWAKWNVTMRDFLVATQARLGHEAGSWHFSGGRGDVGGRLYSTAMAVMTLEVYYRYMPIYGKEAAEGEF